MVEASSSGRGQPKIKSINLEANLLSERIRERERLLESLSRRALAGGAVLAFAFLALPFCYRLQAAMVAKANAAAQVEAEAAKRLAARKAAHAALIPRMQSSEMQDTLGTYSNNFLSQLTQFTNCANARMVLSSLKAEVLGGEMKFSVKADAESYDAARSFVNEVSKLPRTKSAVLKAWRQNENFAPGGVSIEVDRAAEVGK